MDGAKLETTDVAAIMQTIGCDAEAAAQTLATASTEAKNAALAAAAAELRRSAPRILRENAKDMAAGAEKGLSKAMLDRLELTEDRIEGIARGLEAIAALADPVGAVEKEWDVPSGLHIQRLRVPLGVIGVIYESRPNVTADAGGLCLKAGNAAILRGGSESFHSSRAIVAALATGLEAADLPATAIQLVPTTDRAAVGEMLKMTGSIDVIVPRGGKSLIERIAAESRVPLFKHLEGVCHVYVDKAADPQTAEAIVVNAKMRRPGICGAAETLLVDEAADPGLMARLVRALIDAGCEVRGDSAACAADPRAKPAAEEDWATEYLDAIISVRQVASVAGALEHIRAYGSEHTEAIVTEDAPTARAFLSGCGSAIVLWNASTQFADGGEFGMGAEIGISTGKLHARGPVGVEQLTTMKYVVLGTGQTRP